MSENNEIMSSNGRKTRQGKMKTQSELQASLRDVAGLGLDHHREMSLEASSLANAFFRSVPCDFQILGTVQISFCCHLLV